MADFVVHVDAHWVIVDKPAGLPSVPGRAVELHDCAASRVQARFTDALVVHRLDMATSGLLVFARGADAQRKLSRAFAERRVHKRYVAVVHGVIGDAAGSIDLPLIVDWPNRPRQIVDAERGKPSLTYWQVLARSAERTMLALEPVTGRSHQLRVHCAAIGHPIIGDDLYAPAGVVSAAPRLLLHAQALTLSHPANGEASHFESDLPFPPLP